MLVQTTAPSVEPVLLADARLHLRLSADETDEDSLIEDVLIPAARRYAESLTRRSFITQHWRLVMDGFPCCIELEKGPVQRIDSITYRDMSGATQTITWAAPANSVQRSSDGTLVADLSAEMPTITPAFGSVWPIPMAEAGSVAVNFTAGYGDAGTNVPEGIRHWMLVRINTMFENREEAVQGIVSSMPWVDSMLEPFTIATP